MQEEEVDDIMHEAVHATVWYTMTRVLNGSPVVAAAVRNGDVLLKRAVYSLSTGEVTILEEEG
jgi:carbonic anhydrase